MNSGLPASAPGSRAAILLVEDERPLLDVYVAALGDEFDIATATNVREADALLQQRAFKVILADHLMPGETGLSLLIRLRQDRPQLQRILITGYLKPDLLLKCVTEAAVFRCLVKPVSIPELLAVIREAVKAHDATAELS